MNQLPLSEAERARIFREEVRKRQVNKFNDEARALLKYNWHFWARPKQLPPEGDWSIWLLRAGRGFGKNWTGSHWVHHRALERPGRWIALIARTPADARDYMILGPGGIMRNTSPKERPEYIPSNRALLWANGSRATIYSDEVPDQLRGFSGDTAWIDELAKFRHPQETFDNLAFGMRERSTDRPRTLITTTPRPIPLLRTIEKMPGTRTVIGSSYENKHNLDPRWFEETLKRYEGTRLGRQEIEAEIVDDLPGALWSRSTIERCRVKDEDLPEFKRVVIGVDPSGSAGEDTAANRIGIVVVALGVDGHAYVIDDKTCSLSPAGWSRVVAEAYDDHNADKVVAERNFGGEMVRFTLQSANPNMPVKMVTASRGKTVRAEPVSNLYEQGKVHHVGSFPLLEDQLCEFMPGEFVGEGSPDAADALIWAVSELLLQRPWMVPPKEIGLPLSGQDFEETRKGGGATERP